jgi:hypothetical protein
MGELCTEELDPRESGLVVSIAAPEGIRNRANRSLSASLGLALEKPLSATPPCDRARPWSDSGFGETEGLTLRAPDTFGDWYSALDCG